MRLCVFYDWCISSRKCYNSHGGISAARWTSQMSGAAAGPRGATVARLTPDQKVACSNHVGVKCCVIFFSL